jgi:hypothetical protein
VIVTVGPFNKLNYCIIVDHLNIWIALIKTLARIDEKSVRKTSTGCIRVEVEVLPFRLGDVLEELAPASISLNARYQHHISDLGIP